MKELNSPDPDIVLALIPAEIENLKRAIIFTLLLQPALHIDHSLAGGMNRELSEVANNPLASQLLGHCRRSS